MHRSMATRPPVANLGNSLRDLPCQRDYVGRGVTGREALEQNSRERRGPNCGRNPGYGLRLRSRFNPRRACSVRRIITLEEDACWVGDKDRCIRGTSYRVGNSKSGSLTLPRFRNSKNRFIIVHPRIWTCATFVICTGSVAPCRARVDRSLMNCKYGRPMLRLSRRASHRLDLSSSS